MLIFLFLICFSSRLSELIYFSLCRYVSLVGNCFTTSLYQSPKLCTTYPQNTCTQTSTKHFQYYPYGCALNLIVFLCAICLDKNHSITLLVPCAFPGSTPTYKSHQSTSRSVLVVKLFVNALASQPSTLSSVTSSSVFPLHDSYRIYTSHRCCSSYCRPLIGSRTSQNNSMAKAVNWLPSPIPQYQPK